MNIKTKHWMLMMLLIILYAVWKAYVLYTPSPHDDEFPDKVRDAVLLMVYDDNDNYAMYEVCNA